MQSKDSKIIIIIIFAMMIMMIIIKIISASEIRITVFYTEIKA